MKSVLISIQPKWVEKIAKGEKTIEVRKTRPKIETPFKCYIYCTKDNKTAFNNHNGNMFLSPKGWQDYSECNGKVIGEFVCDRVFEIPFTKPFLYYGKKMFHSKNCCKEACLSYIELEDYLGNKDGYGWHISNLVIYDKPKELSEFKSVKVIRRYQKKEYDKYEKLSHAHRVEVKYLERPPQSWCYVESLGE